MHYGFLLIKVAIVDAKYEIYVQNWSRYNIGGVDEVIHTHMDSSSSLLGACACVHFGIRREGYVGIVQKSCKRLSVINGCLIEIKVHFFVDIFKA